MSERKGQAAKLVTHVHLEFGQLNNASSPEAFYAMLLVGQRQAMPVHRTQGDPVKFRASFILRSICVPTSAIARIKWRGLSVFKRFNSVPFIG